jgi:hypothetical protein
VSDEITFEFKTTVDIKEVMGHVSKIWHSENLYTVDIHPNPKNQTLLCFLSYVYRKPIEERMVKEVVKYLFSIISDPKLYYYRCPEGMEFTADYQREITIDELYLDEFKPSYYDGVQYRYLIRPM